MTGADPLGRSDAEQTFFADPAMDRLLGMLFALSAEVHVLRDRLALLESELARRSLLEPAALDRAVPDAALQARISAERTAFVRHVFENLTGQLASKS